MRFTQHVLLEDSKFFSNVVSYVRFSRDVFLCDSYTRFFDESGEVFSYIGIKDIDILEKDVDCLSDIEKIEFVLLGVTLEHEKQHALQVQNLYQGSGVDVDMFKDFLINDTNCTYFGNVYFFELNELNAYKESNHRARSWLVDLVGETAYEDAVLTWYNNLYGELGLSSDNCDVFDTFFDEMIDVGRNNVGIENCDVNSLGNDLIKRFIEFSDDNKLLEFVMKHPNENSKQRDLLAGMAVAYNPLYSVWFPFVDDENVMGHDFIHWKHYCENNMPEELEQERKVLLDKVDSAFSKRNSNRISNIVSKLPLVGKVESVLDDYGLE